MTWVPIGHVDDVPTDGSGCLIEAGGERIALFRDGSEVRAIDDECPHQGGSLAAGVACDGEVACPWHSWHFDLVTGENRDGLAMVTRTFPVRVGHDGVIEVRLT